MLLLLLVPVALAASPLEMETRICQAHRERGMRQEYWKSIFDGFERMRPMNLPNFEAGVADAKKKRAKEFDDAEASIRGRLEEYRQATGKSYDTALCQTPEVIGNFTKLSTMKESELAYTKFVSPAEAKLALCSLKATLAEDKTSLYASMPPDLRHRMEAVEVVQKQQLVQMQESYRTQYGKPLDFSTCPKPAEEPEDVPPPREVVATPTVTATATPETAPPPKVVPLDPWRLSVNAADIAGLDRKNDVFGPSPDDTKACGKRLRAAHGFREVHYTDEKFHLVSRLATERKDTLAFRFRIRRDPGLRGSGTYRDDFVCELFQELGSCWKALQWQKFPVAPPSKNLVYDANDPRYVGPTAYKTGECLIGAWMNQSAVFDEKKKRAREGKP